MNDSAQTINKGISFFNKIGIVCLIMAITLLYSIYEKNKISSLVSKSGPILKRMPSFSLPVVGSKERVITEENLYNDGTKLVLVHYWGTWCPPCEPEIPELISFAKGLEGKKVKVILLAVNDDEQKITKFMKKFGELSPHIIIVHDKNGKTMPLFGTVKVPETYLFGKNGKNLNKYVGPQDWNQPRFKDRLNFYLSDYNTKNVESH